MRLWCEEPPCKVTTWCNSCGVITLKRQFDLGLGWKFKRLHKSQYWTLLKFWRDENPCKFTAQCRQLLQSYHIHKVVWPWASLVSDLLENILVKLQHDACNSQGVIVFTRQLDLELVWQFKMVTQRLTSNSSNMLMWRTSL